MNVVIYCIFRRSHIATVNCIVAILNLPASLYETRRPKFVYLFLYVAVQNVVMYQWVFEEVSAVVAVVSRSQL